MPVKRMVKKSTSAPKASGTKKVKFSIDAPNASEVCLAGDFNNWDCKKTVLKKVKKSAWEKELALKHGTYQYKFVIDGNWVNDPSNRSTAWNSFGTQNSVIEIR